MSSEWSPTTLGAICSAQGGSIQTGPFGSQLHTSDYREVGVPVVMPTNIGDGGIDVSGIARIAPKDVERLSQHKLLPGDIVFSRRGDVTKNALVGPQEAGWLCGTGCLKVRIGTPTTATPAFISYSLRQPETKDWLVRHAVGATMPNLNTGILSAVPMRLPAIQAQMQITAVLGALDERITVLRETNTTLEAIAQALFKSWFVDFDPVRAKMEGRAPEGMDEATAALFPSNFEETPLGFVPREWNYCSLKEVTAIFDAKRVPLSGAERLERKGQYPYYGAAALMDYVDGYLFDGIYLLTGEDGSVADEAGFPITQYVWGKFWVNNHAHILQGANGVSTEHLLLSFKRTNIRPYITGAVQAKLSQSNMWRIKFLRPPRAVSERFAAMIAPLYAAVRQNTEHAQTLGTLRDTLLPRLISGQLRLPQAERELAAVL